MTDRDQLHHLADRARRGVLLPTEGALLADAVTELYTAFTDADQDAAEAREHNDRTCDAVQRAEQAEAAIERVRAAIRLDDPHEITHWNRGYNACALRVRTALDQPQHPTA